MQRVVQEAKKKNSSKGSTNDGLRVASLGLFSLLEDEFILDFLEDWLGEKELLSLSRVSRFFYFFANLEDLWKNICTRKWVKNKTGNFTFKHSWKYTTLFPRKNIPKGAIVPRVSSEGFYCPRITNKWNRVRTPIKNFEIPYCDVDRRDISELSVEEFKREYESKSKPVIITGAMKNWKAMEKWNGVAFLQNYGDKLIKTNGTAHGHCFKLTYSDFKAYMDDNQDEKPLLLFDNKFTERLPELLEDYQVPPYFKEDMFDYMDVEDRPDWRWFLAGAARSGSPLHQDPHRTAAWNAVLCGRKRWAFYPPQDIPPGVDKELIDTEYYASPDVMKWYVDHYPKIPSSKRPIECVVGPGEIMYVPSGYWHTVLNLDTPTIAITQNYCSQENFNYVYDDMIRKQSKSLKKEFEASLQKKAPVLAQKLFSQFAEYQKKCSECGTGFMSESESEGSSSESD